MNKLKKYFIPHKGNDYKPHFFREMAVLATAGVIAVIFVFASALNTLLIRSGSDMLGAVVSSVLVDLANTDRAENKLQTLTVNPALERVAQMKANDMAEKSYFAHTSPEGKTPWYWFKQEGYNYAFAGENLAVYFSDSSEVEKAWMNSPTHRANILNSYFTEIGIAMAKGTYQGKETVYVVQVFGRPTKKVATVIETKPLALAPVKPIALATPTAVTKPEEKPVVKGASSETPVKVLAEEDGFIAVENMDQLVEALNTPDEPVVAPKPTILSVFASPKTFLEMAYSALALFILFALMLMIGIEAKRQHPKHIFYGVALLVLMGGLLYSWQFLVFGKLLIM